MPYSICLVPTRLPFVAVLATVMVAGTGATVALAQPVPYNPYADGQEPLPPVAADGTLRWGTFYKSAAMQKSYERLWNMGACRGTNKAITVPVERNKLVIDNLPEESFSGRVRGTAGTLAGGMVAFTEGAAGDATAAVLVAQLHPAGVSHVQIGGKTSVAAIKPGMSVRLRARVDTKGRALDPIGALDIVSPPADFTPDPIRPDTLDTIVGTVTKAGPRMLLLKIDAGTIRRVSLPLADAPEVTIVDASYLDLMAPGDEVEVTGRRWSGEGSMAAGTIFASRVVVHKPSAQPAVNELGAAD